MATFAAARNLAHDPRPVADTRFGVSGSATAAFVTDRSYSGAGSVFLTIPVGGLVGWNAAANDDADISAITEGDARAMMHYSGASGSGIEARFRLVYTDSTTDDGPFVPVPASGSAFQRMILADLPVNTAKTLRNIQVQYRNVGGATRTVYVGGLDIRVDQTLDGFIHGDAGSGYSWEGTANASPSNREDVTINRVVGVGGQVRPSITVEVCNRQGIATDDISEHFIDGSITYDMDAERHKGSVNVTLDDPHLIQAFADQYLRFNLTLRRLGVDDEGGSLGMFMVDPPAERWLSGSNDQWQYNGKDMLGLLDTWMMRQPATGNTFLPGVYQPGTYFTSPDYVPANGYAVQAGSSVQGAIDHLLQAVVGFSPQQYAIAVPGMFPVNQAWQNNETALKVLSDMLVSVGFQKPWVTPDGIITSARAGENPAVFQSSYIFRTGEDSPVRWPFEVDADVSRVGNRIRCTTTWQDAVDLVVSQESAKAAKMGPNPEYENRPARPKDKKKAKKWDQTYGNIPPEIVVEPAVPAKDIVETLVYWGPAEAVAENLDPAHPLSVPRLGRYIDLPDISIPMLGTPDAALGAARQELLKASRIPMKARLTTEVMLRGLNEVYELDLSDMDGNPIPSGQGKYFCRGWSMQLGAPWEMIHTLTRVIDYTAVSWS